MLREMLDNVWVQIVLGGIISTMLAAAAVALVRHFVIEPRNRKRNAKERFRAFIYDQFAAIYPRNVSFPDDIRAWLEPRRLLMPAEAARLREHLKTAERVRFDAAIKRFDVHCRSGIDNRAVMAKRMYPNMGGPDPERILRECLDELIGCAT